MTVQNLNVDALVVGGGIAGMQSALDLADQGYQVALVEKEASIGGKMIMLSKVFPTLDCCSCITTPKMSAVAHHDNIELLTYCEVQAISETSDRRFRGSRCSRNRATSISTLAPAAASANMPARSICPPPLTGIWAQCVAIRVPFSTAVPQKAILDIENCLLCGKCEKACPVDAIDFTQQPETFHDRGRRDHPGDRL